MQDLTCPPGKNGPGGNCKCTESIVWDQGQWKTGCSDGICYMRQSYSKCQGKVNKHSLGDGTVCWEDQRYEKCLMHTGKFS